MNRNLWILGFLIMSGISNAQQGNIKTDTSLLASLMASQPGQFGAILSNLPEYRVQVIYTQVDRKRNGKPVFTDHYFGVDTNKYYYPASTVKFPIAVLALQKLNELGIAGLNKYSTMITGAEGPVQTEVINDPSAADGRPSIAHYIKKILLVSDNDASNRLYEFLGQEYINENLHRMGYTDVQIIHRLAISLSDEQHRHTNPIRFLDTAGRIIYEKPPMKSTLNYSLKDIKLGKGFMRGSQLIEEPFDFTLKNRMSLHSLHNMIRSIIFPESVPSHQRFRLSDDDYAFLYRYMSMRPGESKYPYYDPAAFWNNYAKIIFYGIEKTEPESFIRIFSKSGWSYGFLTDAVYVVDYQNKVEFMLTAVIYCNKDGILNDDRYDYSTVGYPFMKNLGRLIYDHELKRKRKHYPKLVEINYKEE